MSTTMNGLIKIRGAKAAFTRLKTGTCSPETLDFVVGKIKGALARAGVDERALFDEGTEEAQSPKKAEEAFVAAVKECRLRYAQLRFKKLKEVTYSPETLAFLAQEIEKGLEAAGADECALFDEGTPEAQDPEKAKKEFNNTVASALARAKAREESRRTKA